jgi:hypothetical protein
MFAYIEHLPSAVSHDWRGLPTLRNPEKILSRIE